MKLHAQKPLCLMACFLLMALVGLQTGCDQERTPVSPSLDDTCLDFEGSSKAPPTPPSGLVTVDFTGEQLSLWPYTGASLEGAPSDPVNLVFVGAASPLEIRSALLNLDGNRPGVPPMPPFNSTWSDAIGGAQVCYTPDDAWMGGVVQLQLGDYQPLRFHLRLFQCDSVFADEGRWTIGAAHFEMLIPGTTDHQVLSWELAERMVALDLMRAGLLDELTPTASTGPINDAPSFRTIPAMIYNGIPDALKELIGTPSGPSDTDVPIPSDGEGTILYVAQVAAFTPGAASSVFTVDFQQVIPRPFCAAGDFDFLLVQGPVDFRKVVDVGRMGQLSFRERFDGVLQAIPVDVSSGSPVPIGEPFVARVLGHQNGFSSSRLSGLQSFDRRITFDGHDAEWVTTQLLVAANGSASFRTGAHCVE